MLAHAEDSDSSSLLPPFILNFAPIPPPLFVSTVLLLCLYPKSDALLVFRGGRGRLLSHKQARMCSFISLHHLEILKIQEKYSSTDAARMNQILFWNIK